MAKETGVPEVVVGLLIVAFGTSLPEFVISITATLRRHADVAVGNVLGSNIFNVLGILGVSALIDPLRINERILSMDQWVMLLTSAILLLFLHTGRQIARPEGEWSYSGKPDGFLNPLAFFTFISKQYRFVAFTVLE